MKRLQPTLALLAIASVCAPSGHASILLSESFDSYANGNLVGQGSWAQTASASATPVQVNNGTAVVGPSGQDVYLPLTSVLTPTDGSSFYIGLTFNVSTAQAGSDYFFHFTPVAGDSSLFFSRHYIRSSGAGFQLGYTETSGAGVVTNYSSTVLSLNTDYRLVLGYNRVAGTVNDTANLYLDPSDATTEGNNAPFISDTWTSATAESVSVAAVNLRQGSGAAAPTVRVDDIIVATTFAEAVTPVPEPATGALAALGLGALVLRRSRRA